MQRRMSPAAGLSGPTPECGKRIRINYKDSITLYLVVVKWQNTIYRYFEHDEYYILWLLLSIGIRKTVHEAIVFILNVEDVLRFIWFSVVHGELIGIARSVYTIGAKPASAEIAIEIPNENVIVLIFRYYVFGYERYNVIIIQKIMSQVVTV